jgi:hypothetical protein
MSRHQTTPSQTHPADLGAVTAVTHITTKQDMARWTRDHADAPGITWSVQAAPGGTMLIVEHTRDRAAQVRAEADALRKEVA